MTRIELFEVVQVEHAADNTWYMAGRAYADLMTGDILFYSSVEQGMSDLYYPLKIFGANTYGHDVKGLYTGLTGRLTLISLDERAVFHEQLVDLNCTILFKLMSEEVSILYRPVGPKELELIRQSGNRAFPPRLPEQPIFYPVLNEEYATKIARDWNLPASGSGYVARFAVRADYLSRYEDQTVGSRIHQEYWIPAEDLDLFNGNIVGKIEVIAEFHKQGEEPDAD